MTGAGWTCPPAAARVYSATVSHLAEFLRTWDPAWQPIVLLAVAAAAYTGAVLHVRAAGRQWEAGRLVAFMSGLGVVGLVIVGPVGAFDDTFMWAHMVQHIALMMLAAPLLVLGAPVLLLLLACPSGLRRRYVVPVLRSRAVRWLTDPTVGWVLYVGTVVGVHFSPFYNYALTHPAVHDYLEHSLFLTVALVYYYPLVGANPVPHGPAPLAKIVSLFLQMGPMALTGFFIYSSRSVLYPAYLVADRPFGPDALGDQQLAGGIMWCAAMVIDVVWLSLAIRAWLRSEERRATRLDAALARERLGTP